MNFELVDWYIIGPAMVAGLLVLSTHVPLGQVVLKRGIIFIDLAVAQVAALGVIAAGAFGLEENIYAVQVSAISAAILAAAGLNWTEKHWPEIQEALIGTLFVLAATGSILLLAENPLDDLEHADSDSRFVWHSACRLVHRPSPHRQGWFLPDVRFRHHGRCADRWCLPGFRELDPARPGNPPAGRLHQALVRLPRGRHRLFYWYCHLCFA